MPYLQRDQLLGAYKQKKEDLQDAEEMQKKLSLEGKLHYYYEFETKLK